MIQPELEIYTPKVKENKKENKEDSKCIVINMNEGNVSFDLNKVNDKNVFKI